MQRNVPEGVIICCDFCGTDWDQVSPMIEGHHGSVICLTCLQQALTQAGGSTVGRACTMCLQDRPMGSVGYGLTPPPSHANPQAWICRDCIHQAAGTFSKDPDVNWTWDRKLLPADPTS